MCRLGSSEIGLGCSLQHISRSGVAKQLHVEFFRLGCLSSLKSGIQSSTSSLFSLVPTQSQSLPHESETGETKRCFDICMQFRLMIHWLVMCIDCVVCEYVV